MVSEDCCIFLISLSPAFIFISNEGGAWIIGLLKFFLTFQTEQSSFNKLVKYDENVALRTSLRVFL